jgi:molecular chaperone GrpE (heat shock protein)
VEAVAGLNTLDLIMQSQKLELEGIDLARRFLPLLDQVRRICSGFDQLPPDQVVQRAEGVALLSDLADRVAAECELERVGQPGERVSGDHHEVVDTRPDDREATGVIVAVTEPGWAFRGRVIQRAKVVASVKAAK